MRWRAARVRTRPRGRVAYEAGANDTVLTGWIWVPLASQNDAPPRDPPLMAWSSPIVMVSPLRL